MVAFRAFRGSSVFIKLSKIRNNVNHFTNYYGEVGGFMMEKYSELEVLISKAKSGDQEAIAALNAIMEQMKQFQ